MSREEGARVGRSIFVSYRRSDSGAEARLLASKLIGHFGDAVFIDTHEEVGIQGGEPFPDRLSAELGLARVMLVVMGSRWLTCADEWGQRLIDNDDEEQGDWVRREVSTALATAETEVIPVLLPGVEMPPARVLPDSLSKLSHLNLMHFDNAFEIRDTEQIAKRIEALGIPRRPAGTILSGTATEAPSQSQTLLARYCASLVTVHGRQTGLFARHVRDADMVFVELTLQRELRDGRSKSLDIEAGARGAMTLRKLMQQPPRTGVARRWVVLGDPGAGKSTLARHLVWELARESGNPVIPVYASLPRLASERRHPFDIAEEDLRSSEGDLEAAGLAGLLRSESRRAGRVWLLLDGLDEVTGAQRESLNATLEHYAETLPNVAIVVFSRPVGYVCPGAAFKLDEARIQLLDSTKQRALLAKWLDEDEDPALAADTYKRLQTRPGLREACRVPLLLSLLALLAQRNRSLPGNRVDLYNQAIETLLERGHGETPKGVRDPEAARVVLRELAAHLQQSDTVAWQRSALGEALLELQDSSKQVKLRVGEGKIWHDGAEFLENVRAISGVLADHDGESAPWRFLHRQFKELLVAEALREGGDAAVIAQAEALAEADIPRWAEALGFACELADDPLAVLRKLAEVNRDLALRVLPEVENVDHVEALGLLLEARSVEEGDENQGDDRDAEDEEAATRGEWDGDFLAQLLDRWIEQGGLDRGDAQDWLWRQVQPGRSILELAYLHFALAHVDKENSEVDRERFFRACDRWPESGAPDEPSWVSIPEGRFTMGSAKDEHGRFSDEHQHPVRLDEFQLAATAITNEAYSAFDSAHEPARFEGKIAASDTAQHPVVNISWWEAYLYSHWVGGTLPTEAQWEYACRAGTVTPFSSGEDISPSVVNYNGNHPYRGEGKGEYRARTVSVASLPCNSWGLHEMHGNVYEWCRDTWNEGESVPAEGDGLRESEGTSDRVFRGGGWAGLARFARSAYRLYLPPAGRAGGVGFRPARHHS